MFVTTRRVRQSVMRSEVFHPVAVAVSLVPMEGAHKGGRTLKGVVLGSKSAAASQRKRASGGAAAAARKGQVVQRALAAHAGAEVRNASEDAQIATEVAMSMKKGTTLAQAAVEHLETAEKMWEIFNRVTADV